MKVVLNFISRQTTYMCVWA